MSPIARRTLLRSLGGGTAAGIAGCLGVEGGEAETSEDARMFQYDAGNTGTRTDVRGPTEDLSEQWTVPMEFQNAFSTTQPAVVDGTVYVGVQVWGRDFPSAVLALDADDGTEQWRFETEVAVTPSPAVVDGRVYVVTDETLRALSTDDGEELWSVPTGRPNAQIAVVDGTVYVGGEADGVYAVSAADGDVLWTAGVGDGPPRGIAVDDGRVIAVEAAYEKRIVAFDTANGDRVWRTGLEGPQSYPVVADDTVFVIDHHPNLKRGERIQTLDAATGDKQDRFPTGDFDSPPHPMSIAVTDDTAFVTDYDGGLTGYGHDGTERWQIDLGEQFFEIPPLIVDGIAYLTAMTDHVRNKDGPDTTTGMIYGVTPDGDIALEHTIYEEKTGNLSPPIVVNDALYLGVRTHEKDLQFMKIS